MSCCGTPPIDIMVAKEPCDSSEHELICASQRVGEGMMQTDFVVPDMHCVGCIGKIERTIGALDFVDRVRANLSLRKVSVVWCEGARNITQIDQAISQIGYPHHIFDISQKMDGLEQKSSKELLLALAVAGFAAINIMLLSVSIWSGADAETTRLFHLISGVIAVPAVFYSGRVFFRSAISALKFGQLNMDVPISLAVLLALGMSVYESMAGGGEAYFDAAVMLLFFLLIGRYLDNLMREKARSSVIQLNKLAVKHARHIDEDGQLHIVPLDEISPGMLLRILPGDRFAVDGKVISGTSDVDRSLVTGESIPVLVRPGMEIEAGTQNLNGSIDIKVLRDARHSFLAEISRMMEAAESGRGRFTRIADRMAQIYAPSVHLLAALAFLGWMFVTGYDWHQSIYVAISVLIITCPCALGLAVPVVHVIAARKLFRSGVIIRDGSGFERLEKVDHIVFDKTGTLSESVPKIKHIERLIQEDATLASALAQHSSHPFSKAIVKAVNRQSKPVLTDIKEISGKGIEGVFEGTRVRLGQSKWVAEISDGNKLLQTEAGEFSFCRDGQEIIDLGIEEHLRRDARVTIDVLKEMGVDIELLSGDTNARVKDVADKLGIAHYSASQDPAEKLARINALSQQGKNVLMVGDGLNDSPALAAASVSVAPAEACDIARQNADFVFTRDSLDAVPYALNVARFTGRLVRQNFGMAIIYNVIAVPFAVAGYVTPLIAAIAMSASSIVVVANSMRLNIDREKPSKSGISPSDMDFKKGDLLKRNIGGNEA